MNAAAPKPQYAKTRIPGRTTASSSSGKNLNKHTYRIAPQALRTLRENDPTVTKTASGVSVYGFRYYTPETGRWLSRDPIGENGGENIYAFAENRPVYGIDYLGLALYAFDGTWQDKDDLSARKLRGKATGGQWEKTNVAVLYNVFRESDNTKKYYFRGVGTRGGSLGRVVGGITGLGGKGLVRDAIAKLRESSRIGDCTVDIIGFSRGAALARHFANRLNRGVMIDGRRVKVEVRFLGLFDTVASFGIPGNNVNLGWKLGIPNNVQRTVQATANDETRTFFPLHSIHPSPNTPNTPDRNEQRFLGSHADIGGNAGGGDQTDRALVWMWQQGRAVEVPFGPLPPHHHRVTDDQGSYLDDPSTNDRGIYYPSTPTP